MDAFHTAIQASPKRKKWTHSMKVWNPLHFLIPHLALPLKNSKVLVNAGQEKSIYWSALIPNYFVLCCSNLDIHMINNLDIFSKTSALLCPVHTQLRKDWHVRILFCLNRRFELRSNHSLVGLSLGYILLGLQKTEIIFLYGIPIFSSFL